MEDRDNSAAIAMGSVKAYHDDESTEKPDAFAIEAPLELRVGKAPLAVLMRTPGHDEELVRGFLFTEGIITKAQQLVDFSRPLPPDDPQFGNVISVQLNTGQSSSLRKPLTSDRQFISSSSCGQCGKSSLKSLQFTAAVVASTMQVARAILSGLPDKLRAAQWLFAKTGAVHASGIFDGAGNLVALREDVGRHNALDKLIGWGLAAGMIPWENGVLLVSGRVSYELVQKAAMAGIAIIAAVGAPSTMALEIARKFNITLAGFVRPHSMNVYTAADRIC